MNNILLIWDRMGDYHRARWNSLKNQYDGGEVYAADLGKGDLLYQWEGIEDKGHFCLSQKSVEDFDLFKRLGKFCKILIRHKIGYIAQSGYGKLEYVLFIVIAKLLGRKVILFAESWYAGSRIHDFSKGLFLKLLVDKFFVSGSRAKNHFVERLGIQEGRIFMGYSAIDNTHFSNDNNNDNKPSSNGIDLNAMSLEPYLLCVARYSPEKNLFNLISAFKNSKAKDTWNLIIIGDGPQKPELAKLVEDTKNIHLVPWQSYEDLPAWYAKAEGFILPSSFEPWGLVVNEAMAANLPVLLSKDCGCQSDLIEDQNEFVFDCNNISDIIGRIDYLYSIPKANRKIIGQRNRKTIERFSTKEWSCSIIKMITQ